MKNTLISLLRDRADALPGKTAFEYLRSSEGVAETLTYGLLTTRSMSIAAYLQQRFQPGDRLLLVFPPGLSFVEAFFGCLFAGMVAVPLALPSVRRAAEGIALAAADAQAAAILSSGRYCDHGRQSFGLGETAMRLDWIATDSIEDSWVPDWRVPRITTDDPGLLQYTSGSTSRPRGVVISHCNMIANAQLIQKRFGTNGDTRGAIWLPLHHDMGLIGGVLQPVYVGGSCVLIAPGTFLHRPALWLETISERRITVSGGPNFAYELCLRRISEQDMANLDLRSWEVAFCGAEPIRANVLSRFAKRFRDVGFREQALLPCYGLAEATLMVTAADRDKPPIVVSFDTQSLSAGWSRSLDTKKSGGVELVSCGRTDAGQSVEIVDPITHQICVDGRVGEVWIQGSGVAQGYFGRADASRQFQGRIADRDDGNWLRTGDLGFVDRSELFLLGRLDDRIGIRGRNIYAHDIEWGLSDVYPGLRSGHCVAFAGAEADQLIIVQEVEPRAGDLDMTTAASAIRRSVASLQGVEAHAIMLVAAGEILRTSSGKPRRGRCRERYLKGELKAHFHWEADIRSNSCPLSKEWKSTGDISVGDIKDRLVECLASRLRLPVVRISVDRPFVDYGLTSLDAVEVCSDLENWLGRPVSPIVIYGHPTIEKLSKWLARSVDDTEAKTYREQQVRDPDIEQLSQSGLETWIARQYDEAIQESYADDNFGDSLILDNEKS